ncbi:MAG: 30S ribosomal protein S17 [Patescibacteria group bacterium]
MEDTSKNTHRRFTGVVVSAHKTPKTVVVRVDRTEVHPKYGKRYIVSTKFMAHDEAMTAKEGETVTIEETRPMSARKRWRVVSAAQA